VRIPDFFGIPIFVEQTSERMIDDGEGTTTSGAGTGGREVFVQFTDTTTPPNATNILRPDEDRPPFHPIACFFHLLFKLAALLTYLFLYLFNGDFVIVFITVVTLLALDFWAVKNVTGRTIVALRWWNEVKNDGISHWRFENGTVSLLLASLFAKGYLLLLLLFSLFFSFLLFSSLLLLTLFILLFLIRAEGKSIPKRRPGFGFSYFFNQ
jgi:hypothetical protein